MDAVMCVVDDDGKDRTGMFAALKARANVLGDRILFCAAEQEVETWLLAGHPGKLTQTWNEIRVLEQHGHPKRPSGGRDLLMKEALGQYDGILARCPELQQLQRELCTILAERR